MKLSIRLVMEMANPLLESFGEPTRICVINSSRPPTDLKGKGNPDLPSVCSNYWPPIVALSLCFNPLVLSTFRQCRSAIPKRSAKPIASIHQTVEYPWRNPKDLRDIFQPSPDRPQRKGKPRSAIGLFKLLASYPGSQFVF